MKQADEFVAPSTIRPSVPRGAADSPTRYRHRWEMPLVWIGLAISLIALVTGAASEYVLLLPGAPLLVFVSRYLQIAHDKASAIRVGPDQFPALWGLYEDVAARLGFDTPPRLYIKNGNGAVNAYALSCSRRTKYIILHAEIAHLMNRSPGAVEFVLAHELAHHRLEHVSLTRLVVGIVPRMLPIIGASMTRAQEYSADRLAHSVCARHAEMLSLLMVGPWASHEVDHEALKRQAREEQAEWFIRLANLLSTHPIGVKRLDALLRLEDEGYVAHGDMC